MSSRSPMQTPFDGWGTFADGYDAYLHLLAPEDEESSPLIERFYSEEFVREANGRWRLTPGR